MMVNLFSVFDPTSSLFNLPVNWASTLFVGGFLPFSFWKLNSRFSVLWNSLFKFLQSEFEAILSKMAAPMVIYFLSLFSVILLNNSLGLLPYVFTASSHFSITMSLAIPLWVSLMAYTIVNKFKSFLIHLIPVGTPSSLMFFMVLIETVSNFIRPITLSLRLGANMTAGHLLLSLLSSLGEKVNLLSSLSVVFLQGFLVALEVAVAMIQAYVFSVLCSLYTSESL